jgi:chitodextrinase
MARTRVQTSAVILCTLALWLSAGHTRSNSHLSAASESTLLAQDGFDRANGGLGPNWTVIDSDPRIVNRHVEESFAGDGWDSIAIYTGVTWPANQYSQVRVLSATEHGGCSAVVRAKNDRVIEMYFVYVTGPLGPNARVTLAKFVQHNYTELWTSVRPVVSGDVLYLGVSGSTLTVTLNGQLLTTATDTSITAAGYAGLDITDYDGLGAPGDGQCDDWEAGATGTGVPTDTTAPTVPTNLAGTPVSSSQITLTWTVSTDNVGVTGYKVFRNGSQVATMATPGYADTGLTPSTIYSYSVAAFDAAGNTSAATATISVTTLAETPGGPVMLAQDGFNRANGGLGPNWTVIDSDPRIVNQHVQELTGADGNDAIPIYTGVVWPANQYSQVRVLAASQHSGCSAIVRAKNNPVIEMYFVYVVGPLGPTARVTLAKFVAHNYTELWTGVLPVNAGDVLYLGANGSTLTVKLNGAPLTTVSDTSITAAGFAGLDIADFGGPSAPGEGQCDDWEGGAIGTGTPDATPPSVPTNLAGGAVSSSRINLTWTASTDNVGVTGYKVFRNGSQIATTATPGYGDTGLSLNTSYSYAVAAFDAAGNTSAQTATINLTTLGDTTAPSVPTNLAGNAVSSSQITLTWTASTDNVAVTGYKVFRNGSQIATTGNTSYSDNGLLVGTMYSYAVAAFDAADNTSAQSTAVGVTTLGDTEAPTVPANVAGRAVSSSQVNLTWTASIDNVGVTGYRVFRNGSPIATITGLSFGDSGLTSSTTYSYSVAAFDAAGNNSASSPPIEATTQTGSDETVLAQDSFDRANGGLGPNWTVIDSNPTIVNQHVQEPTGADGNDAIPIYTGVAWPANQYSQVRVLAASQHSGCSAIVRAKNDRVIEMYFVYVVGPLGPTAQVTLAKFVAYHYTELWTRVLPVNVGDVLYLSANGSTLTVKLNGAPLTTVSDASITAAGFAGLDIADYGGPGAPGEGQCDDWEGGAITASTPDVTPPSVPTNLNGAAGSSSHVILTWTASTDDVGVTAYTVYRDGVAIGTTASPAYDDTGLSAATLYSYSVAAADAAGNASALSAAVDVTTLPASGGDTLLARDDFNRGNGSLGPNWTVIDSDPRIVNRHVQETNASDGWDSIPIYTGIAWPANQYAQVRVLAATPHAGCSAIVRAKNDPVIEMYFVYVIGPLGPNAQLVLAKFVRHNYTELWTSTRPVNSGDVLYLGAHGTTLTVKLNGEVLTTATDTSITAPGYAGLDITDYDGQGAPGDGQCDDWEGGAIGEATALIAYPAPVVATSKLKQAIEVDVAVVSKTGWYN